MSGSSSSADQAFLHGTIEIEVRGARDVEGKGVPKNIFKRFERAITTSVDGVDPYCSVKIGYNKVLETETVQNSASPVWNEKAVFDLCHELDAIEFRVKAAKRTGALAVVSKVRHLSFLAISAAQLAEKRVVEGWFPLGRYVVEKVFETDAAEANYSSSDDEEESIRKRQKNDQFGEIHIRLAYTPVQEDSTLQLVDVPYTYFPSRRGCDVTLYQNAEANPEAQPPLSFRPDYLPGRCWRDIARSIISATHFVYLTGWALWPELHLVRTDLPGDGDLLEKGATLGELLIAKAEEGVTVCVMVWDELASGSWAGVIKTDGLMGTHDEEVISYFKKTKVRAIKASRQNPSSGPFADLNSQVMFTHHQKTVVIGSRDDEDPSGRARVTAYVGGLDLTDGRYDDGSHSLFRTIGEGGPHNVDFYQACALEVRKEAGPREPWQDIHCRISGTAAWDVLANFENRWKRQAPKSHQDDLHPRPASEVVIPSEEGSLQSGKWSVQILRSITEASAALDDKNPGLIRRKRAGIDSSIHRAYVHQIRRASRFIYLENQYFLGSSHLWDSNQRGGFAAHLVPIELAEKICAKIRANERFAAYVVVPLYPEGVPSSAAVQEILSFQRKTVALITKRIAKTIRETGSDTKITDWFNVLCLVTRESTDGGEGNGGTNPVERNLAGTRRFMVYVHSKYGCFDDVSSIIGSANLNSRSMDGARDTEICALSWVPEEDVSGPKGYSSNEDGGDDPPTLPKGDVAAFRAHVWADHFGEFYPEFEDPGSLECVHKVRELAMRNWLHFAAEDVEPSDMPHGHAALFPYEFDEEDGSVTTMQDAYPDFPGALIGGRSGALPNILTG